MHTNLNHYLQCLLNVLFALKRSLNRDFPGDILKMSVAEGLRNNHPPRISDYFAVLLRTGFL